MPDQNLPTQRVIKMRKDGNSDEKIVQELQNQGFNTQQIFDAMSQADNMQDEEGYSNPEEGQPQQNEQDTGQMNNQQQQQPVSQSNNPPPPTQSQGQSGQQPLPPSQTGQQLQSGSQNQRIQEIAETIVDERMDEIIDDVKKVVEWKENVEDELDDLRDEIDDVKSEFKELRKSVLGKIDEYDKNMREVTTELDAAQKVFKEAVPKFTENVNKFSRLVDNFSEDNTSSNNTMNDSDNSSSE